jgi:hypothetical protein
MSELSDREILDYIHTLCLKGGSGSGNYGHAGRPGEVGGSAEGSGSSDKPSGGGNRGQTHSNLLSKQSEKHKEHAAILDKDDNVLSEIEGSNYVEVRYTTENITVLQNNPNSTLIHTHPTNNSFSDEDIVIGMRYGIPNSEVVTDKYVYSFKTPEDEWGTSRHVTDIRRDYAKLTEDLMPSWIDKQSNGMTKADAIAGLTHDINTQLSAKYNLSYSRKVR